ncbi:uncharacterized protein At4g08330, chloroplastic-like [Lolium rigidum]|uniref:uncharacterized protein At4g08330, chloroplastic-like n=1 Tax=Lolium rigidum TaxID=89674 RepID=UPI001F5C46B8|nr:uncharacterized protein At4g08330, chloroplastic-like [Lolium rigidum]
MARTLDGCYSAKDVSYSCGYCGYALNLSSSTRNTANIGSKYGKQIRKGVISFYSIDESRFTQTDEVSCTTYIPSTCSWGFFRNRTRLVCRKCGGHIGDAYEDEDSTLCDSLDDTHTSSDGSSLSIRKKYVIKINALQPSSDDSGVPSTL